MRNRISATPADVMRPEPDLEQGARAVLKLGRRRTAKERAEAAPKTIRRYPGLIDWYIRLKEDTADEATKLRSRKVAQMQTTVIGSVQDVIAGSSASSHQSQLPSASTRPRLAPPRSPGRLLILVGPRTHGPPHLPPDLGRRYERRTHAKRVELTGASPSLPQRAGRALAEVGRGRTGQRARGAAGDRGVHVRGVVRPDPNTKQYARAIIRLAEELERRDREDKAA